MNKLPIWFAMSVLAISSTAWGAMIDLGMHEFLPAESQVLDIIATGGEDTRGFQLNFRVTADAGEPEPTITNVELVGIGGIWDTVPAGANRFILPSNAMDAISVNGLQAEIGVSFVNFGGGSDTVPASGLVARVTINAEGLNPGQTLGIELFGGSGFRAPAGGSITNDITDGEIVIIPEPSSVALLLGLAGLAAGRRRRATV